MKRITHALIPAAACAALLLPLAPVATATTAHTGVHGVSAAASRDAAAVTRDTVIARAQTWLTADDGHQVPYSQSATWDGYRTDCSGYVSMALELAKPGPNTVGLATSTYTSKIAMGNLEKGDLVIDATGTSTTRHAVIFEKWTSSAHTAYWAYEQRGGHGTDHRTLTYGLGTDDYDAYRPNKY
ncbi:hypothetical protein [Streptomyces odontomachi]|uniref:hypothetical protein n=1 Tax=Streptomyces odontomachi TaxID=2944940 RepID=UPI00210BC69F|nr:hypothetical protein [Streptomyces sp. ODS25]